MKKIFKYVLGIYDNQTIEIASDRILSVEEQNEKIVVYAVVDTEKQPVKYEFGINGTGNPITFEIDQYTFLGTVKMYAGSLIFHVFYRVVN